MADVVDSPTTAAEPPVGVPPAETAPATDPASTGAPETPAAPATPETDAETTPGTDPPPVAAAPPGYVPGAKFNKVRKDLRQVAGERDQMAVRLRELEAKASTNDETVREANTMRDLRAVLAENPELEAMVLAQLQSDPKPGARANGKTGVPVARLDPEIEKSLKTVASGMEQDRQRREREDRARDQQGRVERIDGSIKGWLKTKGFDPNERINPRDPEYTRYEQVLDHLLASAHRHNGGTLDEEDIPEYLEHLDAVIEHSRKSARVGYAKAKAEAARSAAAAPPPSGAPITREPEKPPHIRDTGKFNDYIKRVFGGGASAAS